MRVLALVGSLRQNSTTKAALLIGAEMLVEMGVTVDLYDLRSEPLPFYDPDADVDPPAVKRFLDRVKAADGFLIGSPEYHNAMTGVLKNALDFLGSRQVRHKPVALLVSAGGGKGGMNGIVNLRTTVRGVMGLAIPEQVIVDEDDFDEQLQLTRPDRRKRIEAMVRSLVRYLRMAELERATV